MKLEVEYRENQTAARDIKHLTGAGDGIPGKLVALILFLL